MVVANLLQSVSTRVTIVTNDKEEVVEKRDRTDIEQLIVSNIIAKHLQYTATLT